MKTVIILRGLPGSGKSTFMGLLHPCSIVSMDLFWTRGGQAYNFDYNKLSEAIKWTQDKFIWYLNDPGTSRIVIDNISYAWDHYKFFYEKAKEAGCMVHVVHIERRMDELDSKHGVPKEAIERQAANWEPHR
jgi:hypothetical protein